MTPILRILSTSVRLDAVSTCVYYQTTYYTLSTYLSTVPPLEKKVSRRGIIVCLIAQSREGDIYFQISFFSLTYLFVNLYGHTSLVDNEIFHRTLKIQKIIFKRISLRIFFSHLKANDRQSKEILKRKMTHLEELGTTISQSITKINGTDARRSYRVLENRLRIYLRNDNIWRNERDSSKLTSRHVPALFDASVEQLSIKEHATGGGIGTGIQRCMERTLSLSTTSLPME